MIARFSLIVIINGRMGPHYKIGQANLPMNDWSKKSCPNEELKPISFKRENGYQSPSILAGAAVGRMAI